MTAGGLQFTRSSTVPGRVKAMAPTHVYMKLQLASTQITGTVRTMRGQTEQIVQESSHVINKNHPVQQEPFNATLLPPYAITN